MTPGPPSPAVPAAPAVPAGPAASADVRILAGILRTELAAVAYYEELVRLVKGTHFERFTNDLQGMVDEEREHSRQAWGHLTRLRGPVTR